MTKLLVIDDDNSVREALKSSLKSEGYEVFTAGDAANGLEIFCRENPYIVLTAIRIPDLDGIEVLRRAKAQDRDAQLLFFTVNGELRLFRVLLRWQVSWDTRGGHGSHKAGLVCEKNSAKEASDVRESTTPCSRAESLRVPENLSQ